MATNPDAQLQTMIDNMPEKTGKSLEEWFAVLGASGETKHGNMMKLLKGEFGVTHGFANTISALYRKQSAGDTPPDLVADQYAKKAALRPIYDKLIAAVQEFGDDVEIAPKKTTVSLRRSKQFGLIKPSTKTRIDLGIQLKGDPTTERLEDGKIFGGMCSHRVRLSSLDDVDDDVIGWLHAAYQRA